jgi:hypothetical protein
MSQLMAMYNQFKDQPSQPKGVESSNPMGPNPHQLFRDPMNQTWHQIPKVDLNKFDVSNPTSWVT